MTYPDTEYADSAAAFDACKSYVEKIMENSSADEEGFIDPRPTFPWKCRPNRPGRTVTLRMPHADLKSIVKRFPDADYTFHVERKEIPYGYYKSSDSHDLNVFTIFTVDFTPYGGCETSGDGEGDEDQWKELDVDDNEKSGSRPVAVAA